MPEISRFYGIVIKMYHDEHPPPHFHAEYAEFGASFSIPELKIIEGNLPKRVKGRVIEWAFEHRFKLTENWKLATACKPTKRIAPL